MRKKFLIFCLVILTTAFLGIYLFLQTDKSREFVKTTIENAVSYTPNFKMTIEELSGNLINSMEARNVEITIGGETFVRADRISTSYSIPLILSVITRGDIPLYNTQVDGVEVNIIKHKDGRWNYQKIRDRKSENEISEPQQKKEKKRSKFSLFLKNNKANGGSIKIINQEKDSLLEFKIAGQSLFSVNLIGMNKRFEIEGYDVNVDWLPKGIRFRNFSTNALLAGQNIAFTETKGEVQGIEVAGQGIVNDFRRPEFNFSAYFNNLSPGDIGKFNIYTKSKGKLVSKDNLDATIDLSLIDSELRGKRIWTNLKPIKINGTQAKIEGNINTEFGRSFVNGEYDFFRFLTGDGKNTFNFEANLKEVNTNEFFDVIKFNPDRFVAGSNSSFESDLLVKGYWNNKLDHNFDANYANFYIKDNNFGNLSLNGISNVYPDRVVLDLNADIENLNIKSILEKYEFNNSIYGNIKLKGNLPLKSSFLQKSNLDIESSLNTNYAYGLSNIRSNFIGAINKGQIFIDKLDINSDNLLLNSQNIGSKDKPNLDFNFNSNDLSFLSNIDEKLSFSGQIISKGTLSGNLENPSVDLKAEINNFEYKENYSAKNINLDLKTNSNPKSLQLFINSDIRGAQLHGKYFDKANISAETEGKTILSKLTLINGEKEYIDSNFSISDISKSEKEINISRLELQLNENNLKNRENIYLTLSPNKKLLKNFNLTYRDGFLESEGELNSNGKVLFTTYINNLDQNLISTLFRFNDRLEGKLSGDLGIKGTLNNPELNLNLVSRDIIYENFESKGLNINIFGKNRSINVNIKSINKEVDELSLIGNIYTDLNLKKFDKNIKTAELDLNLNANKFDISFLKAANNSIRELEGTFSSNVKIGGTISEPLLKGVVTIAKTEFQISQLLNKLTIEEANITFDNDLITTENAKITSANGSALFSGNFNLKDITYSAKAQLDKLFLYIPSIKADLSGEVNIEGKNEKIDVTSKLRVANKRISFIQQGSKSVKEIKFIDDEYNDLIVFTERELDYFTKNFKIKMVIEIPRETKVKTKGSEVNVVGELTILKDYNSEITYKGNIDTLGGHYIVFGKLFNIDDGSLNFPGTSEPNPQVSVTASYEISDIEVFINITGTAKDPIVTFSSNPPLDKDDIVSYLVYGTSREDRGNERQTSVGGGIAANVAAGEISKLIGSNLGLDVLNFQGGDTGGLSDPQILVGSFITDDIFVSYERSSDPNIIEPRAIDTDNKIKLEWKINSKFSVESELGDQNSGADFIYKFDF